MPVLSSFMSYRPKRKTKPAKSPFTTHRFEPSSSSHPYASPEIIDINERSSYTPPPPEMKPVPQLPTESDVEDNKRYSISQTPSESPKVKLNLDINPEQLSDWFGPSFSISLEETSLVASSSGLAIAEPSVEDVPENQGKEEDEDEDDSIYSSSDDILYDLEALDMSQFVTVVGPARISRQPEQPTYMSAKKGAPAPIKIPNVALHGPKVQVDRSSDLLQSRPDSMISSPESSAVSGTTLARAIMGNTFVLSGDIRMSRYRSGMSTLTRQDSATLPRGENAYLNSPYWRDRTISGGETTMTPISGVMQLIPPPPVPSNAEHVYVPPRTPHRSAAHFHDKAGNGDIKKRTSISVLHSRTGSDHDVPLVTPISTSGESRPVNLDTQALRRISRISEASSTPSTPENSNGQKSTNDSKNSLAPFPLSGPSNSDANRKQDADLLSPTFAMNQVSPGLSTVSDTPSSAKDIDNVLDYYSFADTPEPTTEHHFRPPFSPISEESISQLSPQSLLKRESIRNSRVGSSSSTPSGRVDWNSPRKTSDSRMHIQTSRDGSFAKQTLLPIGERPHSIQLSPGPSPASSKSYYGQNFNFSMLPMSISETRLSPLLPPPVSKIFNRQRSGSAPSPIKVVRDSKDFNAYKITVTPRPGSPVERTPTTGDSDGAQQTFPETPSAFSPIFSPITSTEGPAGESADYMSMIPYTPTSAILTSRSSTQPSLSQQVLLTRAATSVRGARASRQPSLRGQGNAMPPHSRRRSSRSLDLSAQDDRIDTVKTLETAPANPTAPAAPTEILDNRPEVAGVEVKPPSEDSVLPYLRDASTPTTSDSHSLHNPSLRNSAAGGEMSSGADIVVLSANYQSVRSNASHRAHVTSPASSPLDTTATPPAQDLRSPSPRYFLEEAVDPLAQPSSSAPEPLRSTASDPIDPPFQSPGNPPVVISPPPPSQILSPHSGNPVGFGSPSPLTFSFGSPPPYETVVYDNSNPGSVTPSTAGSSHETGNRFVAQSPPTPFTAIQQTINFRPLARETSNGGRPRTRPPLPFGPRRPSQQHINMSSASGPRERNGSVSSIASTVNVNGRRLQSANSPSPKFQTPPLKWRGYTMDAAKWTFTSAQLQGIVSRAIRQSAEASSIRLLRLETLDNDIPDEIQRLEMQRTDIKTKYKMLARRRAHLLESLTVHVDGSEADDPIFAIRLVEDLKEVSISLDKAAEELHSLDEQLAQLSSLCDIHSASALAMALRKLNASFLKQFAETQALRQQVEALEAERDEAWKQAEDVANDFDHFLSERPDATSSDSQYSRRSSRVSAVRKSSIRVTKAGLRSSGLRSQRSSMSSNGHRMSSLGMPSSARTTIFSMEEIPPVPPIPRQRPYDIVTDLPTRSSRGLSTDGVTPNSETRAMVRAQEELYDMLGISNDKRVRRSRSVIGIDQLESSPVTLSSAVSSARPISLPGNSMLPDAYNAMTADVSIILSQAADRGGWI